MTLAPSHAAAAALLLLALAPSASAQSNWVHWVEETSTRLQLSVVPGTDDQEKDVTVGDFDKDGDTDLVVVRKLPFSLPGGRINLLLMNENGVLVDRTTSLIPAFMTADDSRDILAFDCNGDGWVDLVTASTFDDIPRLFINQGVDGGGTFLGWTEKLNWFSPAFVPGPQFCAVYDGDVDNDGDPDLYFSDYNNLLEDRLLINDGAGQFTDETATRFPTGINNSVFGTASFICDFTGDGWNDILKVSGSFEPMKLLVNGGGGIFTLSQTLDSNTVYMARTADFDLDGRRDFYVVSDNQDYLLTNDSTNPNETINTTKILNVNSAKTTGFGGNVHVTDLDRDGFPDLGVADVDVDIPGCTRRFAALRNRLPAQKGFTDPNSPTTLPWNSTGVHDFEWIDINSDGFMDLFQARCSGYRVFMMEPFAVADAFGEGCNGPGSEIMGAAGGAPSLGNAAFSVTLERAAVGVAPSLLVSTSPGTATVAGCSLFVALPPLLALSAPLTDALGNTQLALPIPADPILEDVRVFAQWLIPDPTGPIGAKWALSGGLELYLSSNVLP